MEPLDDAAVTRAAVTAVLLVVALGVGLVVYVVTAPTGGTEVEWAQPADVLSGLDLSR